VIDDYITKLSEKIEQMENIRQRMVKLQENGPYCCEILHQLVINDRKEGEVDMRNCECGDDCSCGSDCKCYVISDAFGPRPWRQVVWGLLYLTGFRFVL